MRKLLIGCGIAVTLVAATLIVAGIFVTSWFKKQFPEAGELKKRRVELVQKYGRPEVFVPPLEGVPDRARLESFVALRESLVTRRDAVALRLGSFVREAKRRTRPADRTFITKVVDAVGMTQGGASMVTSAFDYLGKRTRMMLGAGMGEGEYDYLYALTTFADLHWDPLAAAADTSEAGDDLRRQIAAQKFEIQTIFERQLGNLQKALDEKKTRTPNEEAMLNALCTELPAARDKNQVPFAGGLPPHIVAALAPYESRLRACLPRNANGAFLDVMQVNEEESRVRVRWNGSHGAKKP